MLIVVLCSQDGIDITPLFQLFLSSAHTASRLSLLSLLIPATKASRLGVSKEGGGGRRHSQDCWPKLTKRLLHVIWCCFPKQKTSERRRREIYIIKVFIFRSNCYTSWGPTSQEVTGHQLLLASREYIFLFSFASTFLLPFFIKLTLFWCTIFSFVTFFLLSCRGEES